MIKINCDYTEIVPLDSLYSIQEDLKDAVDLPKLKASILNNGFLYPVFMWHDKKAKVNKIIDGVHRTMALRELEKEGHKIEGVPVVKVNCKTQQEAKDFVLRASARYTLVNKREFQDYVDTVDMSLIDLHEELAGKNFKFLSGLIDTDDIEPVGEVPVTMSDSQQSLFVSGETPEYAVYKMVFDTPEEVKEFWELMSWLRLNLFDGLDYKDILFMVVREFANI